MWITFIIHLCKCISWRFHELNDEKLLFVSMNIWLAILKSVKINPKPVPEGITKLFLSFEIYWRPICSECAATEFRLPNIFGISFPLFCVFAKILQIVSLLVGGKAVEKLKFSHINPIVNNYHGTWSFRQFFIEFDPHDRFWEFPRKIHSVLVDVLARFQKIIGWLLYKNEMSCSFLWLLTLSCVWKHFGELVKRF